MEAERKRKLPCWLVTKNTDFSSDFSRFSESGNQVISVNDPETVMKDKEMTYNLKDGKKPRQLPACFYERTLNDRSLSLLKFPGKIDYCCHKDECNFICEDLRMNSETIVCGFDIEWKVYSKQKTPLIQLCPSEERCYLFHLCCMTGFPSELKCLLESEEILKVGVGISSDILRLKSDYGIAVRGIIDLSSLANQKTKANEKWSLTGLVMNLFKKRLDKDSEIRCGDWEQFPLSDKQMEYAALDAYAGFIIYRKLVFMDQST